MRRKGDGTGVGSSVSLLNYTVICPASAMGSICNQCDAEWENVLSPFSSWKKPSKENCQALMWLGCFWQRHQHILCYFLLCYSRLRTKVKLPVQPRCFPTPGLTLYIMNSTWEAVLLQDEARKILELFDQLNCGLLLWQPL